MIRYAPSDSTLVGHAIERLHQAAMPAGGQDPPLPEGAPLLEWMRVAGIGDGLTPHETVALLYPNGLVTSPHNPFTIALKAMRTLHLQGVVERRAKLWRRIGQLQ